MSVLSTINSKNNKRAGRLLTLLVLIAILLSMSIVLPAFFSSKANHAHNMRGPDSSCSTCVQVSGIASIAKQTGAAALAAVACGLGLLVAFYYLFLFVRSVSINTLVFLRVRLDY